MLNFIASKTPTWFLEMCKHLTRKYKILKISSLRKTSIEEKKRIIDCVYLKKIGKKINWSSPKTYTEKMQYSKLYCNEIIKSELTDKILVRDWISKLIGNNYLIPILGIWENYSDIDFTKLPNKFVLKTNHGTGTNVIVTDKGIINHKYLNGLFDDWIQMDFAYMNYFEMHYSKIRPLIYAEEYLETEYGQLQDYKFLCFNGQPKFCWVDMDRFSKHTRNVYDMNWNLQKWNQSHINNYHLPLKKPNTFEQMKSIASILSKNFSHVRVDLYEVNDRVFFGEMTFTNGSGLDPIIPVSYDLILGNMWNIIK